MSQRYLLSSRFLLILAGALIPLVGITSLGWNIYDVYFLFLAELYFMGVIGVLKLLTCMGGVPHFYSGLFQRTIRVLGFGIIYCILLFLALAFIVSNYEYAAQVNITVHPGVLWLIFFTYLTEFLTGFLMNRKFRIVTYADIYRETLLRVGLLILVMWVFTYFTGKLVLNARKDYLVGVVIIFGRTFLDAWIGSWMHRKEGK